MYTYRCSQTCTHIYTDTHLYIFTYTYTYIHRCTYAYIHIYTPIHTYTYAHVGTHTCIHIYTQAHTSLHIHIHVYIYQPLGDLTSVVGVTPWVLQVFKDCNDINISKKRAMRSRSAPEMQYCEVNSHVWGREREFNQMASGWSSRL